MGHVIISGFGVEHPTYALNGLTETSKTESLSRKRWRGMRLYLFGPAVFVGMMFGFGSVALAGAVALGAMAVSHAHLERSAPYLAGLEQPLSTYIEQFAKGNIQGVLYTLAGLLIGYGPVSQINEVIPEAITLPALSGMAVARTETSAATILIFSIPVLLLADLLIYTYHRAAHQNGNSVRWRMHRIHHSIPHFELALGAHANPVETVITYVLCGAAGGALGVGLSSTMSAGILMALFMSPHHINSDSDLGFLSKVFVTTEAHRWHHHVDHRDSGNFALLFSFWDRLLRTHHEPRRFSGRLGLTQ